MSEPELRRYAKVVFMQKSWALMVMITLINTSLIYSQSTGNNNQKFINKVDPVFFQQLSEEEKNYLLQNRTVKVCADPNWMPYERIHNGEHEGISAEILDLISKKTGIEFRLIPTETWSESLEKGKARECDIFPLVMETPERKVYMNFTTPFVVIPLVIATTKEKPFIADLSDLTGKRIGLVTGYAFTELIKTEYPDMEIAEFRTIYDGLAALEKNEIYGFIDNLTTISYEIGKSFSSSIKISGRVNRNWELAIAVRNDDPFLYSILEKAVLSLDEKSIQDLESKWISVTYEHKFDYSLMWKILTASGIIVVLIFYRSRKITRYNFKLKVLNMRLKESEESLRSLVENAHEGIIVVQNRKIVYTNPRMCHMTGYDKLSLLSFETFLPLIAPESREKMIEIQDKRLTGKVSPVRYESHFLKKDGSVYPIEMTGVLISWKNHPAILNIISDISERKSAEESIRFMAFHDNLTSLPNRYLLKERLEQALAQARRREQPLGVLFLDLNGFKQVNDRYGHEMGDLLLKGVAERLQKLMRVTDTLARMGGDEFVVLLPGVDGIEGVEHLVSRIHEALKNPFRLKSLELTSTASVGFSLFPGDGDCPEILLQAADQHMYRVKQAYK